MPDLRHRGPHLGFVALAFVALKLASLFPVTAFGTTLGFKPPYFPADTASAGTVAGYFATHSTPVLILAFLQLGSVIPLGIFAAAIASQLRFLGVRAAGTNIAFFGGLAAALDSAASSFVLWVLARAGIAGDALLTRALHFLAVAFGGVGYAMPIGLLMAGVSVTGAWSKLLPKWIAVLGLALAITGELSWLAVVLPRAAFLIPLTRFPGFVWMIAAGFALPRALKATSEAPRAVEATA